MPGRLRSREAALVLGGLVVAQWIAIGILAALVHHHGWLFYQGGDETYLYTTAWVLSHGHLPYSPVGYVWPFLLTPVAGAVGSNYLAALPPIVLLQTLVLLPVALYCVHEIARRVAGRRAGYLAAALWVSGPFLAIPFWRQDYHAIYVDQFLPQALGLTGLADFPSLVCLLVAALFCLRALDGEARLDATLAGLAAGLAVGIKPANALFLAGPALAFFAGRRARDLGAFALALAPALATLVLWKYRGLGYVPLFRASVAGHGLQAMSLLPVPAGLHRYVHVDWSRLGQNYTDLRELFLGAPIWQALPILGFLATVRRSLPKALLLGGWLGAFLLVKGGSDVAGLGNGSLLRLLMPALPALVLLAALAPFTLVGARQQTPEPPDTALGRGTIAALVAVAGLPLLLVAVLPTYRGRDVVKYADESVMIPAGAFAPALGRSAGGERLSWHAPASSGARVFYRVFRRRPLIPPAYQGLLSTRDGVRCARRHLEGYSRAAECWFEMQLVGVTRRRTFLDRPPPGPWAYRIGVAANWIDDPGGGDVLMLSAPARAPGR